MMTITWITIVIAVLMFEVLIMSHEFGHFIAARKGGVRVNEFAIGMGPAIFKKQRGETLFSIRIFPIGGYCAMEGEDEGSDDPGAFTKKKPLRRLLILVAGSFMNFLVGFIIIVVLTMPMSILPGTVLSGFSQGFVGQEQAKLEPGDKILNINGNNIYVNSDISIFLERGQGDAYTFVVRRDGKRVTLNGVALIKREFTDNGVTNLRYGLEFTPQEANIWNKLGYSWLNAVDYVRLVRIGLFDLITGNAGTDQLMGAVGVVDYMNTVTQEATSALDRIAYYLNFAALIAINLAVMNLLPLPALDGGRILFVLVELIRGRPVKQKYEALIHMIGFAALILLMVYVSYNDIARIVGRG